MNEFKVGEAVISKKSIPSTAFFITNITKTQYEGFRIGSFKKVFLKLNYVNKNYHSYVFKYKVGDKIIGGPFGDDTYEVVKVRADGFTSGYCLRKDRQGDKSHNAMFLWAKFYVESDDFKLRQKVIW